MKQRLDRGLCNDSWRRRFPEASILHLPCLKSDHRPLLLQHNTGLIPSRTNKPFRFFAGWLADPSFEEIVQEAWVDSPSWNVAVNDFQHKVTKWNSSHFGNIFHKKKRIMARLERIDRSLSRGHNRALEDLQKQLWKEYHEIMAQEELFWFQKSRCNWFKFGDRNTRFYHTVAVVRRKRNKIEALINDGGDLITDRGELRNMARDFFMKLYTAEGQGTPFPVSAAFPSLPREHLIKMQEPCSTAEIKEAVFQMGPFKAPGVYGLHPVFYQSQWDTIGPSLCATVQDIWANPHKVKSINQTLLVLIPKTDNPQSMKNFRPISMCNVSYKIITKIIANRLKNHLSSLIAPFQCSFIPGRHSSDNIIIAQENFHTMRTMRGKRGFMAVKVDLEKAYDRLS